MSSKFWANIHGGSTHFPIALIIASVLFDLIGYVLNRQPHSKDLHAAAFYALLLGALASFIAVLSGLMISGWHFAGAGLLAKHHLYVWPAFGLIVALAVWRLVVKQQASRYAYGMYLVVSGVAAVLMALAGYWGGELQGGG